VCITSLQLLLQNVQLLFRMNAWLDGSLFVSQCSFQEVPCVARAKKNNKFMYLVQNFCVHNVNFIV
jgi:hypothetical protein